MKQSRSTAGDPRPAGQHAIPFLSLALGALMIFALLAGQPQAASAQYPVLPTATPPASAPATATPVPVPPTATPVPVPPTATPVPVAPTATVAAAAPTAPPAAQPTAAPTKPAALPTAGAAATAAPTKPAVAGPTATPAAFSVPMVATATSGGASAVPSEGPIQSALRAMLTGLGIVWLILGVAVLVLAVLGIGYLFTNRRTRD